MLGKSLKVWQVLSLAAVFALLAAMPALAQSPTLNGYTGIGGESQTQIDQTQVGGQSTAAPNGTAVGGVSASNTAPGGGAGPATGSSSGSGSLPFTGLDLLFISTAGIALLLAGIGLRRATRRRQGQAL